MRVNVLVAGLGADQNSTVQNGAGDSLAYGRVHVDGSHRGNLQMMKKRQMLP